MKSKSTVVKTKAESQPIPKAVQEVFGTVETPLVLPDEQPKPTKTISRLSRGELLGLTKELQKINPKGKRIDCEAYKDFFLHLFAKRKQYKDMEKLNYD